MSARSGSSWSRWRRRWKTWPGSCPQPVLLMLDPNWRAPAIPDARAQLDRIRRLLARTDILKTSSEDLAFLVPGRDVPAAARTLLGWGARCVLVTDGPAPVQVFTPDGQQLTVPAPHAEVVDTVGAGDAFGGGFLAWWAEHGLSREQLADRRAADGCRRRGCLGCGADLYPGWRRAAVAARTGYRGTLDRQAARRSASRDEQQRSPGCRKLAGHPALVAQRIEHLTTDQKVGGSSPSERAQVKGPSRSRKGPSC